MDDPKETVKKFLQNEGYPLEMYVANEFRKVGFDTYQSTFYTDYETGKPRELDVVAYYEKDFGSVCLSIKIIVECKYAQGVWVLFSSKNEASSELSVSQSYCANYAGNILLERLWNAFDESSKSPFRYREWFKMNRNYGYKLVETGSKKSEEPTNQNKKHNEERKPYSAIMTLVNALEVELDDEENHRPLPRTISIFIPVIVIQGKLTEAHLDEQGEIVVNEIDEGQLIYKSQLYEGTFPLIEVITKENVPTLAAKIKQDFKSLLNDYPETHDVLTELANT